MTEAEFLHPVETTVSVSVYVVLTSGLTDAPDEELLIPGGELVHEYLYNPEGDVPMEIVDPAQIVVFGVMATVGKRLMPIVTESIVLQPEIESVA